MEKSLLSVVIIAKNEEQAISDCLKSLSWVDDVLIVDDFSEDKTVEIAKSFGARVIQKKMENEGKHRNEAYQLAKHEWVLSLDADESVSSELKEEIHYLLQGQSTYSGFSIPLRNYIGDRWVRYGGWYPAKKLRLFQKSRFAYEEVGVHPRGFLDGAVGSLNGDIVHKGYPNFSHFLQSLDRQTTLEAEKWFNESRPIGPFKCFVKAWTRFIKRYFLKQGYRDGTVGFVVAFFDSLYQILSYVKYWELKKNATRQARKS